MGGVNLILNIAAAGVLFFLFPVRLKLNFPGVTLYIILMVWLLMIHFMQPDYALSLKRFFTILMTQFLIVVLANYAWRMDYFKLVDMLLYYLAIVLALAIYVHVTKIGPIRIGTHIEEFRMGGLFSFGQAATLGGLGFLLAVYQLMFNPASNKILYGLLTFFFLYCLVASDLRTAIGACMLAASVQYVLYLKSRNKNVIPFILMAACLYGGYKLYVSTNAEGAGVERDFEYRQLIWKLARHGIYKRPIMGWGNSTVYFKGNIEVMNFNDMLMDPHSSYLALMLQSGVVACVLLLSFLLRMMWMCFTNSAYHTKALISLFAYWMIVGSTGGFMYNLDYEITAVLFAFSILAICGHPVHRTTAAGSKELAVRQGMFHPALNH